MKDRVMTQVWATIIAGGKGTRLFPYSFEGENGKSKQFCNLTEEDTFVQATAKRFIKIGVPLTKILVVVTNDIQRKHAEEQLVKELGLLSINVLKIASSHGYAGAMVKAAEYIYNEDPEAVIINTPSDHFIDGDKEFEQAVKEAIRCAKDGDPAIIGVRKTDLATVMGCGNAVCEKDDKSKTPKVKHFVEKPDEATAIQLMKDGVSVCNTGINAWKASTIIDATEDYRQSRRNMGTDELMSRFETIRLIRGNFEWYDCGTFKALWEVSKKTPNHLNVSIGEVYRDNCRKSFFYTVPDIELYASGTREVVGVINPINDFLFIMLADINESEKIGELAGKVAKEDFLSNNDFSIGARNIHVAHTNMFSKIKVAAIGLDNYSVNVIKQNGGKKIIVSINNESPVN